MQITVNKDGQDFGPLSLEELQSQVADGTFSLEDYAWYEGCDDWISVADVPGIQEAAQPAEASGGGVFLEQDGQQKGPFPVAQLQGMVNQGVVPLDTPAWVEGWADWATVADVDGIKKPRVKVSGAANPLANLGAGGGGKKDEKKDSKKAKKGKEDKEEKDAGDAPRKRRKKKSAREAEAAKKSIVVPAVILLVALALLGGGGFFAWKTFFPGDEDDDEGGGFSLIRPSTPKKKNTPPEDPWELNEWRKTRQK